MKQKKDKDEEEEKMEQEEWKKKLEEMEEEGFTVHRRSDDLMVALLELQGDYVELTPEGKTQPVSAADAKKILAKRAKQEKAPMQGKLPEREERIVTVKEDGPAQVSLKEAMIYIEK
ncbi:MAG: hypothetical protein PHZ19_09215, partial [Candidatus Thermoplasmatota archaeon]|nr:hypothetical protein [Candidatus Thermoplasmatota archaeon]